MKDNKQVKKNIISYLLSFLLMISLISLSLISFGSYSMFSIHGIEHSCEKVGYYICLKSEIMQSAYDLAIPYGLDQTFLKKETKKTNSKQKVIITRYIDGNIVFLDDVFSEEKIREDVNTVIQAKVQNKAYQIDTSNLKTKINDKAKKELGKITKNQQESLDEYTKKIEEIYRKKMVIPSIGYIARGVQLVNKVIWFVIPLSILLIFLSIFLLISIRSVLYKGLRFVSYGILGAGATLAVVGAAAISNGAVYKYNISNAFMRRFFTFFVGHEMLMQTLCGIGMLIVGAILVFITARMKFRGRIF